MPTPKKIDLTYAQLKELKKKILESNLNQADKDLLEGLIDFNGWLQQQLLEKRISIGRLKSMLFGEPKPKKIKKASLMVPSQSQSSEAKDLEAQNDAQVCSDDETSINNPSCKQSGRLSHQSYSNQDKVEVKHSQYASGQACPELCGGRLWSVSPGIVIKISGQGLAKATRYEIEKLRCSLCGYYAVADLPDPVSEDKYDYAFKAQLCMMKYYLGLPFYRIEAYQKLIGIPLPDSTQWDLIEQTADCVYPVFRYVEYLAAQGRLVHLDDTNVRILEYMKAVKQLEGQKIRRGTFTTGVLSYYKEYLIHLNYSSSKHAGENMTSLLKNRQVHLPPISYMCDALSRNAPKNHQVTLIHCLAHARRKFSEIEDFHPEKCAHVLKQFAIVYHNDKKAKELKLSDTMRLRYHQEHSNFIMVQLKSCLENILERHLTEDNGSLGKAIRYTLKHWGPLTQFLRVEGAPLDNNILEASLKIPIRIRKSAMFYKTGHGAFVGSMLLSLIQTCQANEVNPVEYLTALQANKVHVFKEPSNWMPWLYKKAIEAQAVEAITPSGACSGT